MSNTKAEPEEFSSNRLDIKFSEYDFVYTTGQSVSDRVIIHNGSQFEATQLKVTLFLQMAATLKNDDEKQSISTTHAFRTLNLTSNHPRQFPIGKHHRPFSFPPLPHSFVSSSGKVFVKDKPFKVFSSYLNDFSEARKWQTKFNKLTPSSKKSTMKVTVPAAFSPEEKFIPIHLQISNHSENPKESVKDERTTEGESVGEVNVTDGEVIQYLKVTNFNSSTFDCPVFCQTYRLEVEMETSNGTMKVEFPITFGYWKNRPDRKEKPYKHDAVPVNETPMPSAPPMEDFGAAPPPTYEEAMRDATSFFYQPPTQQACESKSNAIE
ncbi:unnamed protein product [Caenorhabditis brenneri]